MSVGKWESERRISNIYVDIWGFSMEGCRNDGSVCFALIKQPLIFGVPHSGHPGTPEKAVSLTTTPLQG